MSCTCMCVSYVEGGMYICVLPRGWYVRVFVFPMWRVVCTYVFYLEDGMYVCVSYVEGSMYVCVLPRGWHVHVCFPCGGWYVRMCLT